MCVCVPTYVFAVVKWADGFSSVLRISPVLGRTVSGWHLSHLSLDLFLLLLFLLQLAAGRDLEKDD